MVQKDQEIMWTMSGETANEYYLAPPIYYYLFTSKHNMSMKDTPGNQEIIKTIQYMMRDHLGAESCYASNWKVHPMINLGYDFNMTASMICDDDSSLIGATVVIVHMANATIAHTSTSNKTHQPLLIFLAK